MMFCSSNLFWTLLFLRGGFGNFDGLIKHYSRHYLHSKDSHACTRRRTHTHTPALPQCVDQVRIAKVCKHVSVCALTRTMNAVKGQYCRPFLILLCESLSSLMFASYFEVCPLLYYNCPYRQSTNF